MHCDWVEAQARAASAAEADAAKLISVLVDEAETDAVVSCDTTSAPQLARASRAGGSGEAGELRAKPKGHTVCDLVGERRDRVFRLVEAFHRKSGPRTSSARAA